MALCSVLFGKVSSQNFLAEWHTRFLLAECDHGRVSSQFWSQEQDGAKNRHNCLTTTNKYDQDQEGSVSQGPFRRVDGFAYLYVLRTTEPRPWVCSTQIEDAGALVWHATSGEPTESTRRILSKGNNSCTRGGGNGHSHLCLAGCMEPLIVFEQSIAWVDGLSLSSERRCCNQTPSH